MGRPLKIAKAQAVLTITDTAETGSIVTISGGNLTTSPTVGIAKGMSFVVATTVGGLTANTIYYVNSILSNTTFDVSATQLSVQPQVMATLTDTTGESVLASFEVVDAYFNNPVGGAGFPATNANTYSVVGGNTAIIGKQVLAQVAIGVNGTGTLYSATDTAYVTGIGTDLANALSVGSAIQVASANINGSTDYTTIGFANTVGGLTAIAVANTNNTGNIIRTTGNAQTLFANGTVRFTANLGGLVSGQVYFVKAIANATAFTVSSTLAGAEVDLSDATGTPDAQQDVVELVANAAVASTGAAFVYANDEAGFIVRQKGKQKYLVTGATSGLTSQCLLANVANTALTPNTMRILATYANSATQTVQSLSDHTGELFTATSGPIATGNIVLANATPVYVTFNTAAAANADAGQPYSLVQIASA
jgi:hypothetical protein